MANIADLATPAAFRNRFKFVVEMIPSERYSNKDGSLNVDAVLEMTSDERSQWKHMDFKVDVLTKGTRKSHAMTFFQLAKAIEGDIQSAENAYQDQLKQNDKTADAFKAWKVEAADQQFENHGSHKKRSGKSRYERPRKVKGAWGDVPPGPVKGPNSFMTLVSEQSDSEQEGARITDGGTHSSSSSSSCSVVSEKVPQHWDEMSEHSCNTKTWEELSRSEKAEMFQAVRAMDAVQSDPEQQSFAAKVKAKFLALMKRIGYFLWTFFDYAVKMPATIVWKCGAYAASTVVAGYSSVLVSTLVIDEMVKSRIGITLTGLLKYLAILGGAVAGAYALHSFFSSNEDPAYETQGSGEKKTRRRGRNKTRDFDRYEEPHNDGDYWDNQAKILPLTVAEAPVAAAVSKNVVRISTGASTTHGVILKGRTIIAPAHLFHHLDGSWLEFGEMIYITNHLGVEYQMEFSSSFKQVPNRDGVLDMVAFRANSDFPMGKGIIRHTVERADDPRYRSIERCGLLGPDGEYSEVGRGMRSDSTLLSNYDNVSARARMDRYFEYDGREAGECFKPLLAPAQGEGRVVVGLHLLKRKSNGRGIAMAVDKQMLTAAFYLVTGENDDYEVETPTFREVRGVAPATSDNLQVSGMIDAPAARWQQSTKKVESLIFDTPFARNCTAKPVILDSARTSVLAGLEKISRRRPTFPPKMAALVGKHLTDDIARITPRSPVRVFTEGEAINGVGELPPMNLKAGAGYPLKHRYPGCTKKDFVQDVSDTDEPYYVVSHPALIEMWDDMTAALEQGVMLREVVYSFPKDELRSEAKREFPRPVLGPAFVRTGGMRQYFGAFIAAFNGWHVEADSWSAVGMNVYGPDWDQRVKSHAGMGMFGFDTDTIAMDSTIDHQIVDAAIRSINTWYTRWTPKEHRATLAKENKIRWMMREDIIRTLIAYMQWVVENENGNVTGGFLTTFMNTFGIAFYTVFSYLVASMGSKSTPIECLGSAGFRRMVKLSSFGDDSLITARDVVWSFWGPEVHKRILETSDRHNTSR